MVKVIGKSDKHVHRTTCRNCASVLEYTKSEEKSISYIDYGGFSNTDYYIICPTCNQKVTTQSY